MRHGGRRTGRFPYNSPVTILLVVANLLLLFIIYKYLVSSGDGATSESVHAYKNFAYITFANNDKYAKGAVVLAMSLMEVGSMYPLVVMATVDVSASTIQVLENLGCIIHKTDVIKLPPELSLQTERWGPAFTKLVAWDKTEYSKLMFLDSDLLIIQNVDYLFETSDTLMATVDADASSCSFKPERLHLINSGVLVFRPSKKTYKNLIQTLHNKTLLASGSINDQDIIVNTMPWQGLQYPIYGAQVTHCECRDDRIWDIEHTKIIHYTAGLQKIPKPWEYTKKAYPDVPKCVVDLIHIWQDRYSQALKFHNQE